jgi:hypothetical protein
VKERKKESQERDNSHLCLVGWIFIHSLLAGVNFANILRVPFAPLFLRQKSSGLKFKRQKDAKYNSKKLSCS